MRTPEQLQKIGTQLKRSLTNLLQERRTTALNPKTPESQMTRFGDRKWEIVPQTPLTPEQYEKQRQEDWEKEKRIHGEARGNYRGLHVRFK